MNAENLWIPEKKDNKIIANGGLTNEKKRRNPCILEMMFLKWGSTKKTHGNTFTHLHLKIFLENLLNFFVVFGCSNSY